MSQPKSFIIWRTIAITAILILMAMMLGLIVTGLVG